MVSQEVTYETVVYLKVMFYSNCYSGSHLYILQFPPPPVHQNTQGVHLSANIKKSEILSGSARPISGCPIAACSGTSDLSRTRLSSQLRATDCNYCVFVALSREKRAGF